MGIELKTETVHPDTNPRSRIAVKQVTFQSRKATFLVRSADCAFFHDHAVSLLVGPIGLSLNPDEAEALSKAMLACAKHYRDAIARCNGSQRTAKARAALAKAGAP